MRIALLLLTLLLVSCRTNPYTDVPDKLAAQVKTFEDVVRWGALENMYLFAKVEPGKEAKVQEGLDNVRVTGYESSTLRKVNDMRWAQTAVIDYVLTDRQVVRRLTDNQLWESEDDGKTWYLVTPVPILK